MMERVEIVVLNWNGWQDTIACIFSIQKQDYPNFHLLVVDNGSTDDSVVQIKKAAPAVELLQTGANLGFGGGCNAGIRLALDRGADFVWLINSDSTLFVKHRAIKLWGPWVQCCMKWGLAGKFSYGAAAG